MSDEKDLEASKDESVSIEDEIRDIHLRHQQTVEYFKIMCGTKIGMELIYYKDDVDSVWEAAMEAANKEKEEREAGRKFIRILLELDENSTNPQIKPVDLSKSNIPKHWMR